MRWPGRVEAGSTCAVLVGLNDVYATIASIVGESAAADAGEDSVSFLPALLGKDFAARESLIHHSMNGTFSIRRGPWKLIDGLGSGGFTAPARRKPEEGEPPGQLYNLQDDRAETRNVYAEHPELVAELRALLEQVRRGSD